MSSYWRMLSADLLLFLVGCGEDSTSTQPADDAVPPGAISNLAATGTGDIVELSWTATGDDGFAGQASAYQVHASETSFDGTTLGSSTTIPQPLEPAASGSQETLTLTDFERGTWFFAIRVADEASNWSDLSNLVSLAVGDSISPATTLDLFAEPVSSTEVLLDWTAPGDDDIVGQAETYELRYAEESITEQTWESATVVPDVPQPAVAGTNQTFSLTLPTDTVYYFALRTQDNSGNWSGLSNVASVSLFPDTTPPAIVKDLQASDVTGKTLTLSWTAPGDDGHVGQAREYDIRFSTDDDWSSAVRFENVPSPQRAGTQEMVTLGGLEPNSSYWVSLRSLDEEGNASDVSASVFVETGDRWPMFAFGEGSYRSPCWSPDGSRVAYIHNGVGDDGNLFVTSADGSDGKQITDPSGRCWSLAWSPDSEKIAFVKGASGTQSFILWTIDAEGTSSPKEILGHHRYGYELAGWSPDGSEVAYLTPMWPNLIQHSEIHAVPSQGGEPRTLLSSGEEWAYYAPRWSQDGTQMILGSTEHYSWDLFVYTFATKEKLRLTDSSGPQIFHGTPT